MLLNLNLAAVTHTLIKIFSVVLFQAHVLKVTNHKGFKKSLSFHPPPLFFFREIALRLMNINDFVILPGSQTGTSVKLKAKNVQELQLKKVQLELENKEMKKKLKLLQSDITEKERRKETIKWRLLEI